jgi:hypothetical protein
MHGVFEQSLWKPQVSPQVAIVFSAESLERRENFAIAALETGVKRCARLLWDGDVDESSIRIDWGVPMAVCLIDADSNE